MRNVFHVPLLPNTPLLRFTNSDDMESFEATKSSPGRPIIEEYVGRHYVLVHNDADYALEHRSGKQKKWKLLSAFSDRNPMTGENVVSFALDSRGGQCAPAARQ